MKQILTALCSLAVLFAYAQNTIPDEQSNPNVSFSSFRAGVKTAYVAFEPTQAELLINHPDSPQSDALAGILEYLKNTGFEEVQWGLTTNTPKDVPSICEVVVVLPSWTFENDVFSNIKVSYVSCRGDVFTFKADKNINVFAHTNVKLAFNKKMQSMYGYKKSNFAFSYSMVLDSEMTPWNEAKLKSQLKEKGVESFEGIYESLLMNASGQKLKLGIIRKSDRYEAIYISGGANYLDWNEGELKATLMPTATLDLFKAEWKENDKSVNRNPYITFEQGLMNLMSNANDKQVFIKLFPSSMDNKARTNATTSGTGFAISSDGSIVTNYHVIKGSHSIIVRGIDGDVTKSYKAKLILEDKNNDLAVIQIEDEKFTSIDAIPYSISSKSGDVGTSVFVLGYPMPATMGDEIKLTNGLISSKSGFQGDVTSYQISAPVQPGNSGGPVFDESGNLLGVVNAKHTTADNASYVIKSGYLANICDLLPEGTTAKCGHLLAGKPLTEQVKMIRDFVYIVEVN